MKFLHVTTSLLLLNSPNVLGFSTVKPLGFRLNTDDVTSRQIGGNVVVPSMLPHPAAQSPLFMGKKDSGVLSRRTTKNHQSLAGFVASLLSFRAKFGQKLRRAVVVVWTATLIFIASATMNIQPSHASTMVSQQPVQERILSATSPSLDKIVDRYVKKHMFEDETYDPVESLYREAYHDATQGSYPRALKEVTASVLGQESSKAMEKVDGNVFGSLLTSALGMLKKRGLSEGAAISVVAASFVVAGPFVFLVGGMVIGGASKRNMNKLMKKRYGDTYTVDATIKTEEDVEAPDDDDDDEDDDDDDDDDDDKDDDDDEKK